MSSIYVRYLAPILIVLACAALAVVRRRRRVRRTAVWQHSSLILDRSAAAAPPDPAAEEAWHRLHGGALEAWLSAHEALLGRASEDGFAGAAAELRAGIEAGAADQVERLEAAVASYPDARRRAELSALLGAARATLAALAQADYERVRRHYLVYRDYRERWRE